MSESVYLGNPNLKKANVSQEWTKEKIEEYAKCMKDPIDFPDCLGSLQIVKRLLWNVPTISF